MHALVAEAMKKAAIVWVATSAGSPAYPVWCMPIGAALAIVTGGDEQPAPGLDLVGEAIVSARGDHGGRIVSWRARVEMIAPGSDAWAEIAPALAGKRLNSHVTAEALAATWVTASTIVRLTPIGEDIVDVTADGSGAAVPRPTPAATRLPGPVRPGRRKRQ